MGFFRFFSFRFGSRNDDIINTGGRNDFVFAFSGNDTISTGAGRDTIFAGRGNDEINSGSGSDKVFAGRGDDIIDAGSGNDKVYAGRGDDIIKGGSGNDYLNGGRGYDTAIYEGSVFDYSISIGNRPWSTTRINSEDGRDRLQRVEEAQFDDFTLFLDGRNNAVLAQDDDGFSTDEDSALAIDAADLLANDKDFDGDTVTVQNVDAVSAGGASVSLVDGVVSYDPTGTFDSLAAGETATDTFSYIADDGQGGSATATVTVTIEGVNDDPDAMDDTLTIGENGFLIGRLLANDSDVEGDNLTITQSTINGVTRAAETRPFEVTTDGGRVASVFIGDGQANSGNDFLFNTIGNFGDLAGGETDSLTFTYTISDGNGGTDTATTTVIIEGNDDPVATNDDFTITESQFLNNGKLLANDVDNDGDDVVITDSTFNGITRDAETRPFEVTTDGGRTAGVFVGDGQANSGNDFLFNTSGNFEDLALGETDSISFSYSISDGKGGTGTAEATVTIIGENDTPDAIDDTLTISEGGFLIGRLLSNDTDVDGDTLRITEGGGMPIIGRPGGPGTGSFNVTTDGGRTASVFFGDGSAGSGNDFLFNVRNGFEDLNAGETDTISLDYTISDGNGGFDTATVNVTIEGVGDPLPSDDFMVG